MKIILHKAKDNGYSYIRISHGEGRAQIDISVNEWSIKDLEERLEIEEKTEYKNHTKITFKTI